MKRRFPNNGAEPNVMSKQLLLNRTEKRLNGCWEWIGYRTSLGYGRVMISRKSYLVHRLAAHLWNDFDLCSPLLICHHCDNPPCINPDHLFVGTVADNNNDKVRKGRSARLTQDLNPVSKLTEMKVRRILKMIDKGIAQNKIAKHFEISCPHVSELKNGLYWKDTWRKHYEIK